MASCEDCMFWRYVKVAPEFGECHFHAPKPVTVKPGGEGWAVYHAAWPVTEQNDLCGEFKP
jgi:hypothetical protein